MKSRRMRWARHIARMAERRGSYGVLVVKLDERKPLDHLEDSGVDRRVILKWIFEKRDRQGEGRHELDLSGSGYGQAVVNAVMDLRVP